MAALSRDTVVSRWAERNPDVGLNLGPREIELAVAALREDDPSFRCYVLDVPLEGIEELEGHLVQLRDEVLAHLSDDSRFQLIITHDNHTNVLDVLWRDSRLHVCTVDPAYALGDVFFTNRILRRVFPDCKLWLISGSIQKATHGCACFALDQAQVLSKIETDILWGELLRHEDELLSGGVLVRSLLKNFEIKDSARTIITLANGLPLETELEIFQIMQMTSELVSLAAGTCYVPFNCFSAEMAPLLRLCQQPLLQKNKAIPRKILGAPSGYESGLSLKESYGQDIIIKDVRGVDAGGRAVRKVHFVGSRRVWERMRNLVVDKYRAFDAAQLAEKGQAVRLREVAAMLEPSSPKIDS